MVSVESDAMGEAVDGPPGAAHTLEDALARMTFAVEEGRFALVGFPESPAPEDLALLTGVGPAQVIREGGETTILLPGKHLPEVLGRHREARVERGLAWIRFEVPMGWEIVGFLARVTGALAAAGVPLGAVCGHSRDHLFVPERYLQSTLDVLGGFSEGA